MCDYESRPYELCEFLVTGEHEAMTEEARG